MAVTVATDGLNQTISSLVSYEISKHELIGKTEIATIGISVFEAGIMRVRVLKDGTSPSNEYALDSELSVQCLDYIDKDDEIVISTSTLELTINKNPFRITFRNPEGKVINEDDYAFGVSWLGEQVTNYKKLQPNERFIGLGEKTGPLDKRGRAYTNWNTDRFAYDIEDDPLYASIPFYIGIHSEMNYGIFFNNSHKTHFNFGASNNRFSSFSADAGELDYFFIHQENIEQTIAAYSRITGKMPLPPLWSLGYQQCRYSYYPDFEVINTAKNFRDRNIPADAIVLDIHYMDQFKLFTWDNKSFPDPKGMIEKLHKMGFKVVIMCDPGIKVEKDYFPYEDGLSKEVFIEYPDGSPYEGEVWPGWCHFPDFTSEKGREWWKEQLAYYTNLDIDGYWNDMNEIATWGQSLPNMVIFDFDKRKATAREARNVYGLLMSRATYNGTKENLQRRPFNLTRSGFAGIQRYAAVWTGDNVASDEHMMLGIRMLLGMGLSGVPFCGFDTGGFEGNADERLFARWLTIAAFTPFFRGHTNVNTMSSEPWTFGEHVEEISRNYINLRYRLMPYLYSVFHKASALGIPVIRSLAIYWPFEPLVFQKEYESQFLLGDSVMIVPVSSQKELVKVLIPKGGWYDLFSDHYYPDQQEAIVESPLEKLPVFVKSSAMILLQDRVSHTGEKTSGLLELHVYGGEENHSFNYYEDDGSSFEYEEGAFYQRNIDYLAADQKLTFGDIEGVYKTQFKKVKVFFHGFEKLKIDGQNLKVTDYRFVDKLSELEPFNPDTQKDYLLKDLQYYITDLKDNSFSIHWNN